MLGQIIEVVESDRRLSLEYGSLVIKSSTVLIGLFTNEGVAVV